MKLDPRIIKGKKPLTCFDLEQAKDYVGKNGYFSDYLNVYTNIRNMEESVLQSLDEHHYEAFVETCCKWAFFLPAEWVKETEKKYRPFSLDEFLKVCDIGDSVYFKKKNSDEVECAMFLGYVTDVDRSDDEKPGACEVMLGVFHYSLFSLFEDFERFYNGRWWPFGVEEESELCY